MSSIACENTILKLRTELDLKMFKYVNNFDRKYI